MRSGGGQNVVGVQGGRGRPKLASLRRWTLEFNANRLQRLPNHPVE